MKNDWNSVEEGFPEKDDIYQVRLETGKETTAFYYWDAVSWLALYGIKCCKWWEDTHYNNPLFNVTHWKKISRLQAGTDSNNTDICPKCKNFIVACNCM